MAGMVIPCWLREWGRGWLLFFAGAAAFGYLVGVPHVLIHYEGVSWYGSRVWTQCHYLGPFGMVAAHPGHDVYEDCPGLVLLDWKLALLGRGRE